MRLVLATGNQHKIREFGRLLPGVELEPLPPGIELPPETGDSFQANALIKARAAAAATGRPAIADDSGIEAEALGGRPGIYSARYAGPNADDAANLDKLRAEAPPGSGLRYVCALVYVAPPGGGPQVGEPAEGEPRDERVFVGTCEGTMAERPRGNRGFGYDPIFLPAGENRTMAELTDAEKDSISHRGNAARALLAWLRT